MAAQEFVTQKEFKTYKKYCDKMIKEAIKDLKSSLKPKKKPSKSKKQSV